MSKYRNIALILLWALLAYRVYTMVTDEHYDRSYLVMLALFAWLGGLVTNELLRLTYHYVERIYGERIPEQIWRRIQRRR